jgi:hypothetical protein
MGESSAAVGVAVGVLTIVGVAVLTGDFAIGAEFPPPDEQAVRRRRKSRDASFVIPTRRYFINW